MAPHRNGWRMAMPLINPRARVLETQRRLARLMLIMRWVLASLLVFIAVLSGALGCGFYSLVVAGFAATGALMVLTMGGKDAL
jgi:hypothetical protein